MNTSLFHYPRRRLHLFAMRAVPCVPSAIVGCSRRLHGHCTCPFCVTGHSQNRLIIHAQCTITHQKYTKSLCLRPITRTSVILVPLLGHSFKWSHALGLAPRAACGFSARRLKRMVEWVLKNLRPHLRAMQFGPKGPSQLELRIVAP